MNSIVKINSNEGGQFNAQNNRVSFSLPGDRYYDLSKAYLNLVMSCDVTTDPSPTVGKGVYVPVIRFANSAGTAENYSYENSALIRTAKLDCELRGNIEEIQRADILTQNLNTYSKSSDMQVSEYYEKLIQPFNPSRTKSSLFCELHKEGDIQSRNLSRQPIRIKLSEVLNFCKTTQYNTGKYGKTTLELELNLDRIATPTLYLPNTAASEDWVMTNTGGGSINEQGRFVNASNVAVGTSPGAVSGDMTTFYVCSDDAAGAGKGLLPRIYNRLEDSVYYVGQKLQVNADYTQGGAGTNRGTIVNKVVQIVKIDYNRGGANGVGSGAGINKAGTIAITFNEPIVGGTLPLTDSEVYFNIKVRGLDGVFGNGVVADYAELVVEELAPQNVQPEPDTIQYTTYKTEEIDTGAVNNFQHTFQAEPEAITMYITQPVEGTDRTILSRQNDVDSYRIRINNKDASARNIFLRDSGGANVRSQGDDPLHIVKQQNALVNSGRDIMNFNEKNKNLSLGTGVNKDTFDTDTMLIGQVLPMTSSSKMVQVNMTCRTGQVLRNLCVFREVLQEI